MPRYSKKSAVQLDSAHPDLQRLFRTILERGYDHTVLQGHRSVEEQEKLFAEGHSRVKYGKHNVMPSNAVDVAPFPINWADDGDEKERRLNLARFYHFAGYVKGVAEELGIKIRWGGDWDSDNDFFDQTFNDLVHYERVD